MSNLVPRAFPSKKGKSPGDEVESVRYVCEYMFLYLSNMTVFSLIEILLVKKIECLVHFVNPR